MSAVVEHAEIATAAALDALPEGTVLIDAERWLWLKRCGEWQCGGNYGRPFRTAHLIEQRFGPFLIVGSVDAEILR